MKTAAVVFSGAAAVIYVARLAFRAWMQRQESFMSEKWSERQLRT